MATAFELRGLKERNSVAVIGDGAITGGMAYEAMNNAAYVRASPCDRAIVPHRRRWDGLMRPHAPSCTLMLSCPRALVLVSQPSHLPTRTRR
eukprot:5140059-Prymnesium_polylepis.1